jgi:hypothetical protein
MRLAAIKEALSKWAQPVGLDPAFVEFSSEDTLNKGHGADFNSAVERFFFTMWHRATPQAPWRYIAE